jgi:hypothetical protein
MEEVLQKGLHAESSCSEKQGLIGAMKKVEL